MKFRFNGLGRSVIKSISWRILGTLDTMTISWFITGKLSWALSIASVEVVTKMVLYIFHEQAWNKYYRSKEKQDYVI